MKNKSKSLWSRIVLFICGICLPISACSDDHFNNIPVAKLDLNRYLGTWYEIARYDHYFERNLYACTAHYSLNEDGTIKVLNAGLKDGKTKVSEGKAKTTATPGKLRVSFFGPFYSDYRVLLIDEDYSYALVGSGDDDYLWILSRTPDMSNTNLSLIMREIQRRGYDTDDLIWVDQSFYLSE